MAIDFKKWNEDFGGEAARKALADARSNEYKDVPDGNYKCKLEDLELTESKKKQPMLKAIFRIVAGEYKKQCLFLNQVLTPGFPTHKALEFMRSLNVFDEDEIDFDGNFETFNDLVMDLAEEAEAFTFDVIKSTDGQYTRLEVVDTYE